MQLVENFPLARYSTFYIGGPCRYLIYVSSLEELKDALGFAKSEQLPFFILGGGSNLLVSDNGYNGVVIKIELLGIDLVNEQSDQVVLKVASGENWDDVVRFAVEENWWGIENLSHIPGTMGAFCVQNVGAYGQEASQVVTEVEVFDTKTETIKTFTNDQLDFGYRSSIFNSSEKGRYVILSTSLVLFKKPYPNLEYGDLKAKFSDELDKGQTPNIEDIRLAVIEIRDRKFPFPDSPSKGNSGSFFRGPILTESEFESLLVNLEANFSSEQINKLKGMKDRLKVSQGYKTPSAFLIELCGLSELIVGGAMINLNQPAIILNFSGDATSSDVLELYKVVSQKVYEQTSVRLGIEPELLGFAPEELNFFQLQK